ncbi:MAG: hypothetical protein AAB666_00400 [Patescibacteria group bacterium]
MDQEIKNEFEELARMVAEGFQSIEERMATKDDLKNFATKDDLKNFATKDDLKILEKMMEDGFSSLRSELSTIRKDLVRLEEKIDQLAKTETEDVSAAYTDIADLRKRVEKLERQLQVQPA